jgi:hypothetical protein
LHIETSHKESSKKRHLARIQQVENLEAEVDKKFAYVTNLRAICAAKPSASSLQVVRKGLEKLDLPPDVKERSARKAAIVRQIQRALEVLSRVERLNNAHGLYTLNSEAMRLIKLSKELERSTPITDSTIKTIDPLSRPNK